MFFVFIFIFVKICSIENAVAADVSNSVESSVLCSQATNSPPRKSRRQTADKKASAKEFEEQLARQLTDSTHISPARKNNFLLKELAEKENKGPDNIAFPPFLELAAPPMPSAVDLPYSADARHLRSAHKKRNASNGSLLMPSSILTGETDDEDDLEEKVSPAYRRASRQSTTPRSIASLKKTSPRLHYKESDECDDVIAPYSPDSTKGKLTPRQRQVLYEEFKINERSISLMDGCNRALHLKASDPAFATLLEVYSAPEEKEALITLKDQYPSPIRSPHLTAQFPFYSPAARVGLGRSDLIEAKEIGLVAPLPADAFLMPSIPETTEEKAEIRKHQQELLEELERERGKSALEVAAEIETEAKIWEKYFSYIQLRKTQIANGEAKKIRKSEILGAFEKLVQPHYQMVKVGSYKVYFSMASLDLKRYDTKGRSNLQRIKDNALCPIGPDHFEMNYHHLTQHDALSHGGESTIVLITKKLHTDFSGSLHFREVTYQDLPRIDIDRAAFGQVRASFGPAIVEAIEKVSYDSDAK